MSTNSMNEVGSPVDERLCFNPQCKKPLVPREEESPSKFKKRKHCDSECSRTNPLIKSERYVEVEKERLSTFRNCAHCKKDFHRRRGEPKPIFENRETCSTNCGNSHRATTRDKKIKEHGKTCEHCGETFYRRKGTETTARFKERKTCGRSCGHSVRIETLGHEVRTTKKQKIEETSTLPPSTPLKRKIPEPPPSEPTPIWRPANIGRDVRPKISA